LLEINIKQAKQSMKNYGMYFLNTRWKDCKYSKWRTQFKLVEAPTTSFEFWQPILSQNIVKYVRIDLSTTKIEYVDLGFTRDTFMEPSHMNLLLLIQWKERIEQA
jgi:hypothetical protein